MRRLPIRFFGTNENSRDGHGHGLAAEREDDLVSSYTFAVIAFPFSPFERNHVPRHGIGFHLGEVALNLRLPVAGKLLQLLDGRSGEFNGPTHL